MWQRGEGVCRGCLSDKGNNGLQYLNQEKIRAPSEEGKKAASADTSSFGQRFNPFWASLVAQLVKNLPAVQETWVRSLGWEDPLEKGKATHSSILAWRNPWTV